MKEGKIKYIIAILLIIIFTFSVVPKTFQNDTFYCIELGRSILRNGVDWQDHYSVHKNLEYCYPHWAFDVILGQIFTFFGETGIYVFTQIFASVFILIIFWNMLRKDINFYLALISSLIIAYMMKGGFYARGQIISYSIFLLEFMILENFVDRPTFFKTLALIILSVIMANVHSTAWIMMLILVLPFIGEHFVYLYSLRGINERLLKKYQKMLKKAKENGASEEKINKIKEQIEHEEKIKIQYEIDEEQREKKIIIRKRNNIKYIWIAIIALIIGALITPIKSTPFLYVLRTSLDSSMTIISEHLPVIMAGNLEMFSFSVIIIAMLGFTKSKLKLSDAFLLLGLYLMALYGVRNVFVLIGLTSGIVVKMIDDFINDNINGFKLDFNNIKRKTRILFTLVCIVTLSFSSYFFIKGKDDLYISKEDYPIDAVEYIKENLDYKNIRFYNDYDYGSYLLMQNIPVFIDSRCDLYTLGFNKGIKVFDDYATIMMGRKTISKIMDKYNLEYAIIQNESFENTYMEEDDRYVRLYKDKYFSVYQYVK